MSKHVLFLLFVVFALYSACNCEDVECRSMQPLAINFENYSLSSSDHLAIELYERGSNFTTRLSGYAISTTEETFYKNADAIVQLYRYDTQSPEKYDFKLILLKDSSVTYLTQVERKVITRRSCGYFHTKEAILYFDDCPMGNMKVVGDKVKLQNDGSLLWTK